jgi:hypothetical protein
MPLNGHRNPASRYPAANPPEAAVRMRQGGTLVTLVDWDGVYSTSFRTDPISISHWSAGPGSILLVWI